MGRLADCYYRGQGVREDRPQSAVWLEKAVGLGDADSKACLGNVLVTGDAQAGVAKDAARGFQLLCQCLEQGVTEKILYSLAVCYWTGDGVEKDAAHAVTLLRQLIEQGGMDTALAQEQLARCYILGDGVEADTVQAALWCQRAVAGGSSAAANVLLRHILRCNFCGKTSALQLCSRCRKVRYCNAVCQAAHWTHATDPHKGHCRRTAQASEEAGTAAPGGHASSSAS